VHDRLFLGDAFGSSMSDAIDHAGRRRSAAYAARDPIARVEETAAFGPRAPLEEIERPKEKGIVT
jgi:hypothetical protein